MDNLLLVSRSSCSPGDPAPQRQYAWLVHDIKEVEGERQQEVQEDKRNEEIGSDVNGEVGERVTQRAHETWR